MKVWREGEVEGEAASEGFISPQINLLAGHDADEYLRAPAGYGE